MTPANASAKKKKPQTLRRATSSTTASTFSTARHYSQDWPRALRKQAINSIAGEK
jgi:hypothetical protein